MSTLYGKSYRQEVKDVNEGQLTTTRSAVKSGGGVGGQAANRVTRRSDGKAEVINKLVNVAGGLAQNYDERQAAKAYAEGYESGGTEEGKARAAEMGSTLHTKIFGEGATLRGLQERMVTDATTSMSRDLIKEIKVQAHKLDDAGYQQLKAEKLAAQLDKYQNDPAMQDKIRETYRDRTKEADAQHYTAHEEYVQFSAREYVKETALNLTRKLTQAKTPTDGTMPDPGQTQVLTNDLLDHLDDASADMSTEARATALAQTSMSLLAEGDDTLHKILEERGDIAELGTAERAQYEEAVTGHTQDYDFRIRGLGREIEDMASDPNTTMEQLQAAIAQAPEGALTAKPTAYVDQLAAVQKREAVRRQELATHVSAVRYGDTAVLDGMNKSELTTAVQTATLQTARELAIAEKEEYYARPDTPARPASLSVEPEDLMFQIYKNPTAFKKILSTPKVGEVPIVRELFAGVAADLSKPEMLEQAGARDTLAYKIEAASKLGDVILSRQLGEDAAGTIMDASKKLKVMGMSQTEVFSNIALMNAIKKDPTRRTYEWNEDQLLPGGRRDATTDEAYGGLMKNFKDHEERGVKNRGLLKQQMAYELDTQIVLENGDYHKAASNVAAIFARGTTFVGNNWVHKGAKADVNFPGGSVHDFLNGEYQSGLLVGSKPSAYLSKIYNDNNLPDDVDLLRDAESIQSSPDGKTVYFHIRMQGRNFLNTQVRVIAVPAPPPGTPLQKRPFGYSRYGAWQEARQKASQLNVPGLIHNLSKDLGNNK